MARAMPKPLLLAIAAFLLAAGCAKAPEPARAPLAVAAINGAQDPEIARFYAERGGRPLWVNSGGERRLLEILAGSWSDGFDPAHYRVTEIAAALDAGDPRSLARADLLLSEAWVRYLSDLAAPAAAARPVYAEQGLAPAPPAAAGTVLQAAAAAPDITAHADTARHRNAVYDALRDGFADYRRRWSALPQEPLPAVPTEDALRRRLGLGRGGAVDAALRRFQRVHGVPQTGLADPATIGALNLGAGHYERIIRANLERARAIPPQHGRFVLVDTAAARVWMFEGRRPAGTMRAIVGKRGMETPALAGRLRYAVLNPYWNVPVDLARQRAQRVLREGTGLLARERLQILSQFHADDRVLSPASVNWGRVAAGREPLRLRQLPGGANVMGAVKFMMPNNLDIYLHDFPDKSLFAQADRRISSGCVRLEDAQAFARWLFGGTAPQPSGTAPEQRVDLPAPVPVYISYFTAVPDNGAIVFQADPEGRDAPLIAALAGGGRRES
jgi:murein L,D-transpeptidase YcbB/YkuD